MRRDMTSRHTVLFAALLFCISVSAQQFTGKVVGVANGDNHFRVREGSHEETKRADQLPVLWKENRIARVPSNDYDYDYDYDYDNVHEHEGRFLVDMRQ